MTLFPKTGEGAIADSLLAVFGEDFTLLDGDTDLQGYFSTDNVWDSARSGVNKIRILHSLHVPTDRLPKPPFASPPRPDSWPAGTWLSARGQEWYITQALPDSDGWTQLVINEQRG